MSLFLVALVTGLVLGLVTGGRIRHVADVGLRAAPLAWAALATQLALGLPPARHLGGGGRNAVIVASFVLVGAFLVANVRGRTGAVRTGLVLLVIGWALNVAVVAANSGMPVSADALARSGLPTDFDVEDGNLWKHVPAGPSTRLAPLGDVLTVDGLPVVLSVGDLVMMAGVAVATAAATRPLDRRLSPDGGAGSRVPA